ncbi:NUDIX hydrolase [Roseibium porphyridii]|uniref:NUDIX hydrolase n=1 Tax=Roseibium porphyridii TaxID=2866279 RepID=A0ABY8EXP0_9HYPH|nr:MULTISPECIES: NUDIX hydrolase [Stappiaceae]QFT32488.1 NUDIX domain protein [Labrenzia sp. THAF82]WFE87823.1 NUDIX hydrolase [Roseibium sp. KMA01]
MADAKAISTQDSSWLQGLAGLFFKPARLQIAALCVRPGESEPEILLVSTRDTGRMILPKGWPETDKSASETASIEAYEEAGVMGSAETRPLGSFRSFKGLASGLKIRTKVLVFKVRFEKQLQDFPEIGQRKCVWSPVSEAMKLADEASLRRFLRRHRSEIT